MRQLILLMVATVGHQIAFAGPIGTFAFTGKATGTLNDIAFRDSTLTITGTADTSTIGDPGFPFREIDFQPGMATFTIAGAGSGTFSTLTFVVDNCGTGALVFGGLFGRPTAEGLVLLRDDDLTTALFSSYYLDTSLGPVGPMPNRAAEVWSALPDNMPTSAGLLVITDYDDITFTAVVVPEPSTWAGVLTAAVLAQLLRRYRLR